MARDRRVRSCALPSRPRGWPAENRYRYLVLAASIISLCESAAAAEWRVGRTLGATGTLTDNANLASGSQKKADFYLSVFPGISIEGRSGRSEVLASYTLREQVYLRDNDRNTTHHHLAARGKSEVVKDHLLLEAQAGISQQTTSLLGAIGVDPASDDRNRAQVRSYSIGPTFRDQFGSLFRYQLRYQRSYISTDSGALATSNADKISAQVQSGPAFNRYAWVLSYDREQIDQAGNELFFETTSGTLRYFFNPRFAVLGTLGYEKQEFPSFNTLPSGEFWNVGFQWQPDTLTSMTATIGERFFGRTYSLDFSRRTRQFRWFASYSEGTTTTRSQFFVPTNVDTATFLNALLVTAIPDPVERARAVNTFIATRGLPPSLLTSVNFFSNRVFLQKQADASVAYYTGKTTVALNLFRTVRDATATGAAAVGPVIDDFANSLYIVQKGGSIVFDWLVAPKTNSDTQIGVNRITYRDSGREDEFRFFRTGIRHQLSPKTTTTLDYRHVQRDSSSSLSGANYRENAIVAGIFIRF